MNRALCGFPLLLALIAGSCSKSAPVASSSNWLTVGAYCDSFCGKLCGTCGVASCPNTWRPRCLFNRAADMVMDGKDPKIALARTQTHLDACLATITAASCPGIMAGQVPPACFTIQH